MESPLHVAATRSSASVPARAPDPCLLVLFGATGDLAHRKIVPSLYELARGRELPSPFGVIGTSTSVGPAAAYRDDLRQSLARFGGGKPLDDAAWSAFASGIDTVAARLHEARGVRCAARGDRSRREAPGGGRQPALLPGDAAGEFAPILDGPARRGAAPPADGGAVDAGRDREAVRARPGVGARS